MVDKKQELREKKKRIEKLRKKLDLDEEEIDEIDDIEEKSAISEAVDILAPKVTESTPDNFEQIVEHGGFFEASRAGNGMQIDAEDVINERDGHGMTFDFKKLTGEKDERSAKGNGFFDILHK
ncbi:hypothetical protein AKJ66_00385 [candidate division MSBL1 archaeon SCGC-AAA259E22]|uniref:Uncharacterized protein n=1 Tax=candidate division MSBL1 archaeon SCGC-AAA259E22 TaxID=1698265 RepID=A0A133UIF3_9EURY|nr:hypothetical protein AKJ66_00385 [candidate division MSBL1 archaeon SCGC-AAA259E22]